jgi:hypothetical protein
VSQTSKRPESKLKRHQISQLNRSVHALQKHPLRRSLVEQPLDDLLLLRLRTSAMLPMSRPFLRLFATPTSKVELSLYSEPNKHVDNSSHKRFEIKTVVTNCFGKYHSLPPTHTKNEMGQGWWGIVVFPQIIVTTSLMLESLLELLFTCF